MKRYADRTKHIHITNRYADDPVPVSSTKKMSGSDIPPDRLAAYNLRLLKNYHNVSFSQLSAITRLSVSVIVDLQRRPTDLTNRPQDRQRYNALCNVYNVSLNNLLSKKAISISNALPTFTEPYEDWKIIEMPVTNGYLELII